MLNATVIHKVHMPSSDSASLPISLHSSAFLGFWPQVIGATLDTTLLFLPTGTTFSSCYYLTTESWDQAAIMLGFLSCLPAPASSLLVQAVLHTEAREALSEHK